MREQCTSSPGIVTGVWDILHLVPGRQRALLIPQPSWGCVGSPQLLRGPHSKHNSQASPARSLLHRAVTRLHWSASKKALDACMELDQALHNPQRLLYLYVSVTSKHRIIQKLQDKVKGGNTQCKYTHSPHMYTAQGIRQRFFTSHGQEHFNILKELSPLCKTPGTESYHSPLRQLPSCPACLRAHSRHGAAHSHPTTAAATDEN